MASDVISALDVARSMRRFGVRQIEVICLERPHEMPASPEEIIEASREGVRIHHGWGPERVLVAGGRVDGLVARAVESVFDAAGRFAPTFGEGRQRFQADTLVAAIGQRSNLDIFDPGDGIERRPNGFLVVNRDTLATSNPRVFAGGDSAFGPRIVIDAVGDGKRAALSIRRLLSAVQTTAPAYRVEVFPTQTYQCALGYEQIARVPIPTQKVEQRVGNLPVELGYNEAEAQREALRCLHCWVNTIFEGRGASECLLCNGCADICPEDCIRLMPVEDLPQFLSRASDQKNEATIAPVRGVNDQPQNAWVAMIKDEEKCIRCGLCAKRCPVGVITMEGFFRAA